MSTEIITKRLTNPQRAQVLALMARGDTYADINSFLDKQYGITLNISSLASLKKNHAETVEAMKATIQQEELQGATALLRRSHRILHKKLDRAEKDMTELEKLDEKFRNKEIDSKEYKQQKASLMQISIPELSTLSKNMHDQTKGFNPNDAPAGTSGTGNAAATEAVLNAIKSGDTVELQRLILNPKNPV